VHEGLYTVDHYADKDLYYNEGGVLEFWQVTKPAVEGDLLQKAADALLKAAEVDAKGQKTKDIADQLENIHQKVHNDALSSYLAGDFKKAANLFEQSVNMTDNKILNRIDTIDVYYTGMINGMAGNIDEAIKSYRKCIDMGFFQDGNVFSNLAEIYKHKGDDATRKAVLEEGFEKYPQSQGVLVGLINLYVESGDNPQKLFDLLHSAQENEPGNASLYYVEGNIYKNLGDVENAAKLYRKSSEIDPNYVFGILGVGMLYYDNAVDIQNKANDEYDDNKYMALVKQFEESLENAIEPFEKAFSMTEDNEIKAVCAEYLKNIYFRFRDKSADYAAGYEKYNKFLQGE
jgi:Flp pilus assembly protein TadD, contains TPR repeats